MIWKAAQGIGIGIWLLIVAGCVILFVGLPLLDIFIDVDALLGISDEPSGGYVDTTPSGPADGGPISPYSP